MRPVRDHCFGIGGWVTAATAQAAAVPQTHVKKREKKNTATTLAAHTVHLPAAVWGVLGAYMRARASARHPPATPLRGRAKSTPSTTSVRARFSATRPRNWHVRRACHWHRRRAYSPRRAVAFHDIGPCPWFLGVAHGRIDIVIPHGASLLLETSAWLCTGTRFYYYLGDLGRVRRGTPSTNASTLVRPSWRRDSKAVPRESSGPSQKDGQGCPW